MEKTITFTINKVTNNFGGLFEIKTRNPNGTRLNRVCPDEVGVMQLWDAMDDITQDLNEEGYAVLFEMG
jgi:hypothetical protein